MALYHDHNAFLGRWPFRELDPHGTLPHLLAEMQRHQVGSSWVSPLEALFQAEPYTANGRLAARVASAENLEPIPIFNPILADAADRLASWMSAHPSTPAIRLTPSYHGYSLREDGVTALARIIGNRGLQLLITLRMLDHRNHPPVFPVADTSADEAFPLAAKIPELPIVLCGVNASEIARHEARWREFSNIALDTSGLDAVDVLEKTGSLVDKNRLLFGSRYPLFYLAAARAKHDDFAAFEAVNQAEPAGRGVSSTQTQSK